MNNAAKILRRFESAMALPGKWREEAAQLRKRAGRVQRSDSGFADALELTQAAQDAEAFADELEAIFGPAQPFLSGEGVGVSNGSGPPATDAPEAIKWPNRLVNLPDPDGSTDRIVGFRISEGDPILGDFGLSEPLAWLRSVTVDRVTPPAGGGDAARFVPGVMHCAKCRFRLARTNLCVRSGTTGPGDNKSEPCPNGCGPLWPVTWEQEAHEAMQLVEELSARLASSGGSDSLQAFKDYTHQRLDAMGVPVDPESPHKAAGCRIGGRLDWIEQRLAVAVTEEMIERAAKAISARHASNTGVPFPINLCRDDARAALTAAAGGARVGQEADAFAPAELGDASPPLRFIEGMGWAVACSDACRYADLLRAAAWRGKAALDATPETQG